MRGPLVLGGGARQLREAGRRAIAGGDALALDLTRVTQMDAHGTGVIAGLCAAARRAGSSVALAGASPRVMHLLRLSRLDTIIPCIGSGGMHSRSATPAGAASAG